MCGVGQNSSLPKNIFIALIVTSFCFSKSYGNARFSLYPKSPYYVVKGGTASLVWKYYVADRVNSFKPLSPVWFYKHSNDISDNSTEEIGKDNGFVGWKFQISNGSCPPRLLTPSLRVYRDHQATLVVKNTVLNDSGVYGCRLVMRSESDKTSTVKLIVTETPKFTRQPPETETVIEKTDLNISCSAVGPPAPNITWVNVTSGINLSKFNSEGTGYLHIANIHRYQNGKKFKCLAMNNPNQSAIASDTTTIKVYYPPEVDKDFVIIPYCIGDKVNLTKYVNIGGNPTPNVTCSHKGKSTTLVFQVSKDDQYGNYSCRATNMLNNVVFTVQLIKRNTSCQTTPAPSVTPAPGTDDDDVHPGIIAGVVLAVILAIIGVIIAIIFWRRRKAYKQDTGTPKNQTVRMNDVQDNEEFYATAQHNRDSPPEEQPQVQYAKVDKSKKTKKKIPGEGELIYADLDHEGPESSRPSTLRRPTDSNDQGTLYADVHSAQQEVPRYGNLDNM